MGRYLGKKCAQAWWDGAEGGAQIVPLLQEKHCLFVLGQTLNKWFPARMPCSARLIER